MTDVLHIHGRDAKGRPSYTKTVVGEPVVEVTESDMKTMEQWATEVLTAALIPPEPPKAG